MLIWLDDIRTPPSEKWIWCKTVEEVLTILRVPEMYNKVDAISLDNDLGEGEPEGRLILDWLEEKCAAEEVNSLPGIDIHSANPVARERMKTVLNRILFGIGE